MELALLPCFGEHLGKLHSCDGEDQVVDVTQNLNDLRNLEIQQDRHYQNYIVNDQDLPRSLELGQGSQALREPAVLTGLHNRLGAGHDLRVQSSSQSEHSTAHDEENIQGLGQDLVSNQSQGLVGNFSYGQNAGSSGSYQAVQDCNAYSGNDDYEGNILGGVLTLSRYTKDYGSTAGSEAQVSGSSQEAADTIGHEHAVSVAEVGSQVNLGQTEYCEHGQREQQYDNQQVLDLGHQVNAEVVQDEEGMQTCRELGKNMAWLLKCIEAGKNNGIEKPVAEAKVKTNYIR